VKIQVYGRINVVGLEKETDNKTVRKGERKMSMKKRER
jgi:hypothetical protein